METDHDWYRALSAEDRSWVGLVAQAGIARVHRVVPRPGGAARTSPADVFGTAPRELTRSISLGQTLDLVRSVVDVVEDEVVAPGRTRGRAGPARGGAALLARDRLRGRAGLRRGGGGPRRLGRPAGVAGRRRRAARRGRRLACSRGRPRSAGARSATSRWWPGSTPEGSSAGVVDALRRGAARLAGRVAGRRAGTPPRRDPRRRARTPAATVAVAGRAASARARSWSGRPSRTCSPPAGRRGRRCPGCCAAPAWPDAPRPVLADDLLPERVLAGDEHARRLLVDRVYRAAGRPPAARCSRPPAPTSTAAAGSRPRRACCSSTPTPCATASAGSPT